MLLIILFCIIEAKKQIWICNNQCPIFCTTDKYIETISNSSFKDFFLSHTRNDLEIELIFYSKRENYTFEIDLSIFDAFQVALKTSSESKPIKILYKDRLQSFYKNIVIKPDYQVVPPSMIPFQTTKTANINILDNADSLPIPISVSTNQMIISGQYQCSRNSNTCNLEDLNSSVQNPCLQRCWCVDDETTTFSYTFIGVKFAVYGTSDPDYGHFNILLDGEILGQINENSTEHMEHINLFTSEKLEFGEHTVKCASLGEKFEIIKIEYWPTLNGRRYNCTEFIKYSGEWTKESDGAGGVREYVSNGGKAELKLKCAKFWIYGMKSVNLSSFEISYDGIQTSVDQFSNDTIESTLLYESVAIPYETKYLAIKGTAGINLYTIYAEDISVCNESINYTLESNELIISGIGPICDYSRSYPPPWQNISDYIKSVTIKEGITKIGSYSFLSCQYLESINILGNVTIIETYAFKSCISLSSISLPNSVSEIKSYAFIYCESLTTFVFPEKVTIVESFIFSYASNLKSVTFLGNVTAIGDCAFRFCYNLQQIIIPESVTFIGSYTFSGCSCLASIIIPKNVNNMGNSFYDNPDLIAVYYYGSKSPAHPYSVFSYTSVKYVYVLPDYVDDNFCGLPIAPFPGANVTYKIELEELTIMGNGTMHDYSPYNNNTAPWYENASIIKSVNIEEGVTTIGSYSFYKLTNFETIDIPKSVISIRPYAFSNCTKLISFIIPETITTIERGMFVGCSNLNSINIHEEVLEIGSKVFARCINLKTILLPKRLDKLEFDAFYQCNKLSSITIPYRIRIIESRLFYECSMLSSIIFEGYIDTIESYAFYKCSQLTNISLPEYLSRFEEYAFSNCDNLRSITIPQHVSSIDRYLFSNCFNLCTVVFLGDIRHIEFGAFYSCTSLHEITFPESLYSIDMEAFKYCESLTSIIIPKNIYDLGDECFQFCSSLRKVYFLGLNDLQYTNDAFNNTGVTSIYVLPDYQDEYFCGLPVAKNIYDPLISTPMSVGLKQMKVTGSTTCRDLLSLSSSDINCNYNDLSSPESYQCGLSCWTTDATFSYTFKGVQFGLYGTKNISYGFYSIQIDEQQAIILNQGSSTQEMYTLLYTSDVLEYGEHTVRISPVNGTYEIYKLVYYPFLNAIRINSTSFIKTGIWVAESDEIGGVRENTTSNSTASRTIECTKFWVYGTIGPFDGISTITYNDQEVIFSEYSSNRVDNALLYESEYLPLNLYKIAFNINNTFIFNCIYYTDFLPPSTAVFTPTIGFSGSSAFSSTLKFSGSSAFTPTIEFSRSSAFTPTIEFSRSSAFTPTIEFSRSSAFNPTIEFSRSSAFTPTIGFSGSSSFSSTSKFSGSSAFTPTIGFSRSSAFSSTSKFSGSSVFTLTSGFSRSLAFTSSSEFTSSPSFSASSQFTQSSTLSLSDIFTDSFYFTTSEKFTSSYQFTPSETFIYDFSGKCGPYLEYSALSSELKISGNGKMDDFSSNSRAPWNENADSIYVVTIEEGVTTIGDYAFDLCSLLNNVTIAKSVTSIGQYAFNNCFNLRSITVPENVTKIERNCFCCCKNLFSVIILGQITEIGDNAFCECTILEKILFSTNFYSTRLVKDQEPISFPMSLETIGSGSFYGCEKIESIEIPSSVTSIKKDTFNCCIKLRSVSLHSNIKTIEERAFFNCSRLNDISLPTNLETLGSYAFSDCTKLQAITVPKDVNSIGEGCFSGCSLLSSVTFEGLRNPSLYGSLVLDNTRVERVNVPPKYIDENFCGYSINYISTTTLSPNNDFTDSSAFTKSSLLRPIESPTATLAGITISESVSYIESFVSMRSVTQSVSYVSSQEYSYILLENGEYSLSLTNIYVYSYFPYIIYYLSPTYIPTGILLQMNIRKKTITQEQLIGVVCGSVAAFFLILAVIIFIVQRKNSMHEIFDEDYWLSSESDERSNEQTQVIDEINYSTPMITNFNI